MVDGLIMMNTQEEKEAKNNYTGVIYLLKNKINNKKYIGMTTRQINIRLSEHKYDATHDYRNKQHRHLYKAINKYGFENFECTILESVYCENKEDLIEQLRELEKEYIKTFNTRDKNIGYNLTDGGEGTIGYKISEEQREKMSKARKGRILQRTYLPQGY